MKTMTENEVYEAILERGYVVDRDMVTQWLREGTLKNIESGNYHLIRTQDLHDFFDEIPWCGTPYEKGIDDAEKIKRLEDEIKRLEERVSKLHDEKIELGLRLGIQPF